MAGEPPQLNSACSCCSRPPEAGVLFQYSSITQSCTTSTCGFLPCETTTSNTCSPNYGAFPLSEKCFPLRYLSKAVIRTDGSLESSICSITTGGGCVCSTSCSGTVVTTQKCGGGIGPWTCAGNPPSHAPLGTVESNSGSITTTKTYLSNCGHTITYSGSVEEVKRSLRLPNRYVTTKTTYNPNGTCSGTQTTYNYNTDTPDPCDFKITSAAATGCASCNVVETTIEPQPTKTTTTLYTLPNGTPVCSPANFPSYPIFIDCTPEGQTPPPVPPLLAGQGRNNSAYNYRNPYRLQIRSEQRMRFRISHHSSPSCYLKVWVRKKIQNWKWEDCTTGFAGDPPRTAPSPVNCSGINCSNRWSTNGAPFYEDIDPYEWRGEEYNNPCLRNTNKRFDACENTFYSDPIEIVAGTNQSISIESKFSYLENYEPNWPEPFTNLQGCKPNGFPLVNSQCP